jgi:hypothetical protein
MTRRQLTRRAIDPQHKRLMMAAHNARGGDKSRAQKKLRDYMTSLLGAVRNRKAAR